MDGANNTAEEILFVLEHDRFRGISPRRTSKYVPHEYVIRLDDGTNTGHEIEIVGPLTTVFNAAAEALRRTA